MNKYLHECHVCKRSKFDKSIKKWQCNTTQNTYIVRGDNHMMEMFLFNDALNTFYLRLYGKGPLG